MENAPWDTSVGNRFAFNSPDNHTGPLWIAALLGIIYTAGVLILRIYIKRRVLWWDDYLIIASSMVAFCQYSIICYALHFGLGKTMRDVPNVQLLGRLIFSTRILYLTASYLAKFSILAVLYRIFCIGNSKFTIFCSVSTVFTALSSITSFLSCTVRCPTENFTTHCNTQVMRGTIITILDVATEAVMLLLLIYMVWQLHLPLREKIHVIAAFSSRTSVVVFSVFFWISWRDYSSSKPTPSSITNTIIWQQILLAVTVITATLPNLKAFLVSLSAKWGEAVPKEYGKAGKDVELEDISSSRLKLPQIDAKESATENNGQRETDVYGSASEERDMCSRPSTGSGGQETMCRKETTWNVVSI